MDLAAVGFIRLNWLYLAYFTDDVKVMYAFLHCPACLFVPPLFSRILRKIALRVSRLSIRCLRSQQLNQFAPWEDIAQTAKFITVFRSFVCLYREWGFGQISIRQLLRHSKSDENKNPHKLKQSKHKREIIYIEPTANMNHMHNTSSCWMFADQFDARTLQSSIDWVLRELTWWLMPIYIHIHTFKLISKCYQDKNG